MAILGDDKLKLGYARVSTKKQSLTKQIEILEQSKIDKNNIYAEQYTGKTTKRPEFKKMLSYVRPNEDTIVLVRLDRFARNLRMALNAIYDIKQKHCQLKVLTPFPMYVVKREPNGKYKSVNEAKVDMLLMFAQWERKAIIQRMKLGLRVSMKNAEANGKTLKLGRHSRLNEDKASRDYYKRVYEYSKHHSITDTSKEFFNIHSRKRKHITRRTVFYIRHMFKQKHLHDKKIHKGDNSNA